MTKHLTAAFALALAAGGFAHVANGEPQTREDQKSEAKVAIKAGAYTIVSGEKDGKPIPEERIKGSVVVFSGDKIVGTDKDKKEFFAATYTLDATKTPHVIRMKSTSPKEAEAVGLIKGDEDMMTITIIYALPGGEAPKEFTTKEKQHLFVLKKAGEKPDK
jgi:uncharacterized protein (TIGR03067 family)